MKSRGLLCVASLAALLSVAGVSPAGADPVRIQSGHATVAWDDPSWFDLQGDGFHLTSLFVRVPSSPQDVCFRGCLPGMQVDMSAAFGGPAAYSLGQSFTAIVGGVSHTPAAGFILLSGDMQFSAPTVTVPALVESNLTLRAPFGFTGHIAGFPRDANPGSTPLFEVDVVGQGTASLRMGNGGTAWMHPEVTYDFAQQTPVPEPATALLLGSGITGLLLRSRLRRSRNVTKDYDA